MLVFTERQPEARPSTAAWLLFHPPVEGWQWKWGPLTWCYGTMSGFTNTCIPQRLCLWVKLRLKGSKFWVKPPNQLQHDCKMTPTDRNTVGWIECRIYKENKRKTFCSLNVNLEHHPEIHLYFFHNTNKVKLNNKDFCTLHNPIMNAFQRPDTGDTRQVVCVFSIIVPVSSPQIRSDFTQHFPLSLLICFSQKNLKSERFNRPRCEQN